MKSQKPNKLKFSGENGSDCSTKAKTTPNGGMKWNWQHFENQDAAYQL